MHTPIRIANITLTLVALFFASMSTLCFATVNPTAATLINDLKAVAAASAGVTSYRTYTSYYWSSGQFLNGISESDMSSFVAPSLGTVYIKAYVNISNELDTLTYKTATKPYYLISGQNFSHLEHVLAVNQVGYGQYQQLSLKFVASALDLSWAELTTRTEKDFKSSWYGWFYASEDSPNWIYSYNNGWQYVSSGGTSRALYLWDDDTQAWWFTSKNHYPWVYQMTAGTWIKVE
jgi:hypothetical protein